MKLIIGLGNPGDQYKNTRHNLGFMLLDEYAKKHLGPEVVWEMENKFKAEILKLNQDLWLVKPQTFMNNSGFSVQSLMSYYKVPLSDIVIAHDDLDLNLGQIKIRIGGSAGGHHGVESIINTLGDDKFTRVRLGIGSVEDAGLTKQSEHGRSHVNVEHFVLEPFMQGERPHVKQMMKRSVAALDLLIKEGIEIAQNQFN